MSKRLIRDAKGFVHDINQVKALSSDWSNIRLLCDRSLYILQNISSLDVTFLSRYGVIATNGEYFPVEAGSADADDVETAVDLIRRDLTNMTVETTLECICSALQDIASGVSATGNNSCGCEIGSDVDTDDGQEGGPLPGPVDGIDYTPATAITDRKCKAANYIHDSIRDVVTELKLNRADQYGFAGLAFVLSLVATVVGGLIAGPFGLLIGAVVGSFLSMATLLFKASFSLTLLETAILADEQGAVCALYQATSAGQARSNYEAHLTANGATALEIEFVGYLLSNNLLNLLFFAWGDSEATLQSYVATIDCSTCPCEEPFVVFTYGSVVSGAFNVDGVDFTVRTEPWESWHRMIFNIEEDLGCPCVDYNIELKSATPSFAGVPFGLINNCVGTDVWRWNVQGYGAILGTWLAQYVDVGNTSQTDIVVNITRVP